MSILLLLACRAPTPAPPPPPPGDALYFALVDRFADGTPDAGASVDRADPQAWHGGDLAGLIQKVPWLRDQGYGAVWISPVTRARTEPIGEWGAYHGYWMLEPDTVEPRFGTMAELRALSDALHERDMALYLDIVVNHVGYGSPLVEQHPDWFHSHGDIQDWHDPEQVVTHDVHGLPDLAQENPAVAKWLTDAGLVWVREVEPDGFRVDALRHVPPGFLKAYGDTLRAASTRPSFQILGEVFDGNPARLRERAISDGLDSVFDFPLMYGIQQSALCADTDHQRLAANLFTERHLPERPAGTLQRLVTLLDNHDVPRIASVCRSPGPAVAFLYGVRGTPSVTWGTEVPLVGEHEPANRADMPWQSEMALGATLRGLNGLRSRWPALRSANQAIVSLTPDTIDVARWVDGETVRVVHHTRETPLDLDVSEAWLVRDTALEPWDGGPFAGTLLARLVQPAPFDTSPRETTVELGPVELSDGESLFVVGSAPEVGTWSAEGAVPATNGVARFTMPGGAASAVKIVVKGPSAERWSQAADVTVLAGGHANVVWE
ncbi:MAG: alpha-amylase family glycosyl hydrolase [Myxococcota bacterium]